jgi:hypothetical protein
MIVKLENVTAKLELAVTATADLSSNATLAEEYVRLAQTCSLQTPTLEDEQALEEMAGSQVIVLQEFDFSRTLLHCAQLQCRRFEMLFPH